MRTFIEKLRFVMAGESYTPWATRNNLGPPLVKGWLEGAKPTKKTLARLEASTGIPVDWWLHGEGEPPQLNIKYSTESVKPLVSGSGVSKSIPAEDKSHNEDKVFVKRYVDVKGSAGPGYANDTDGLIELVEFNATQLRNFINVPAQHLVIGAVDGYSMEPFLFHGDQVFIDTRYQTFQNDGVYALLHNGDLRYKRVRINYGENTVLLKSDNDGGLGPEVLNEDQANGLRIVGKVIPFKFGHFKL